MPDESTESSYELLDFGRGWKWERFGELVVKRPTPAAERLPTSARTPPVADFEYQRDQSGKAGRWSGSMSTADWRCDFGNLNFQLKLSEQGQVGVFPEQQGNWQWIRHAAQRSDDPAVLNLFGYTGGSSLAAASGGASVVHLDAARSVVAWARENARHSRLENHPIRWITDDASRFVQREIKRKRTYSGLILDPPSFGRGPKGEIWKVETHLNQLLTRCRALAPAAGFQFVVLSCHSAGFDGVTLRKMLSACLGLKPERIETMSLTLVDQAGRKLPSGHCARYAVDD